MNIATCAKTSLKAVVSVPVGIRLQELPSMVKSLCAGIAGNADCSGGELTLTLEGLDETRRIVVSVNNGSTRAFTDVLTDRLIRTPIPGSLRRMTLSLDPKSLISSGTRRTLPSRRGLPPDFRHALVRDASSVSATSMKAFPPPRAVLLPLRTPLRASP